MKFTQWLIVALAVFMAFCIYGANAYDNTCNSRLSYLKDSLDIVYPYLRLDKINDYNFGSFDNSKDGWTGFTSTGESLLNISDNCPVGNGCLQGIYNFSVTSSQARYLNSNLSQNINATYNYTGILFYLKGDGSNNSLEIEPITNITGVTKTAVQEYSLIKLNFTNWRVYFIHFNRYGSFNKTDAQRIESLLITVRNNSFSYGSSYGNFTVDEVKLVDFNYGNAYPYYAEGDLFWDNLRWSEHITTQSYLYVNGGTSYTGNQTIGNNIKATLDYIIQNQLRDGTWSERNEDTTPDDTISSIGFLGGSLVEAFDYLNNTGLLENNSNLFSYATWNITNRTYREHLTDTLNFAFSKYYGRSFNVSTPANQWIDNIAVLYKWCDVSGNNNYCSDADSKLILFNQSMVNQQFGFWKELNDNENIGWDSSYNNVQLRSFGKLINIRTDNLLIYLEDKLGSSIKEVMTSDNINIYLPNRSRSGDDIPANFTVAPFLLKNLTNVYLKDYIYGGYLNWETYGSYLTSNGSNEFRNAGFYAPDYELCDDSFFNSSFTYQNKQNHTYFVYNLRNETGYTFKGLLSNYKVEQRTGLEFPEVVAYWDSNVSYVSGKYNFDVVNNNTNTWYFYSLLGTTLNFSDLDSALAYNTNGSIYGSSTISENDGNINITLAPSGEAYVLDNFNLTEGVNRTHSPLWVSSRNSSGIRTVYNLASNLSQEISGVKFYPSNLLCPKKVLFISAVSNTQNAPTYSCSGGYVTEVTLTDYEPSQLSNQLLFSYTTLNSPLDLKTILLEVAGSTEILAFLLIIIVSIGMGYFNLSNKIVLPLYALLGVIVANYISPLYALVVIVAGAATFYGISKLTK